MSIACAGSAVESADTHTPKRKTRSRHPDQAIRRWKAESEHKLAQSRGYKEWYKAFTMRICKVESNYDFERK